MNEHSEHNVPYQSPKHKSITNTYIGKDNQLDLVSRFVKQTIVKFPLQGYSLATWAVKNTSTAGKMIATYVFHPPPRARRSASQPAAAQHPARPAAGGGPHRTVLPQKHGPRRRELRPRDAPRQPRRFLATLGIQHDGQRHPAPQRLRLGRGRKDRRQRQRDRLPP